MANWWVANSLMATSLKTSEPTRCIGDAPWPMQRQPWLYRLSTRWLAASALCLSGAMVAGCGVDDREPGVGGTDASVAPIRPDPGASCSPGQTQCTSANEAAECSADGTWGAPTLCDGPCIDGRCGGGECAPNTAQCLSVTRVRRCSEAGVWVEPEECEFACVASDCGGVCKPSQTRCASAANVETCSPEGEWGPSTACTEGCSRDACVGECSVGEGRCASSTQAQICGELEQWQAPVSCSNACIDGACGGSCIPNTTRCASSTTLETCSEAGEWAEPTACANVCLGSACGGECSPGAGRCNAATGLPQVCSVEGAWQDEPACPFVCTGEGSCGGECVPDARRCNPQTGIPQLCDSGGTYRDQTPCSSGEVCTGSGNTTSCTCQDELTACSTGCFDLDTDPNNCGSCGHSCQGSTCSSGRCNPTTIASGQVVASRMALNATELFFATNVGDLYRITKEGAGLRSIVISSNVRGLALDGNTVYWGLDDSPGQIWRVTQSGNGTLTNFANSPDGLGGYAYRYLVDVSNAGGTLKTDAIAVSGGFVYWVSGGYRRASTTATIPAAGELLGAAIDSFATTSLMAPAGACVYGVDTSLSAIVRACTGGAQASVYEGNLIMDIFADASAVYFSEHSIGIKRMALNSDSPTITTLAPTSAVPLSVTTDEDFVYFIDGALTADLCAPNMTIKRVSKDGGDVTTLVQLGSTACPKVVSVDDTFLYYATWDDPGTGGAISRVAK